MCRILLERWEGSHLHGRQLRDGLDKPSSLHISAAAINTTSTQKNTQPDGKGNYYSTMVAMLTLVSKIVLPVRRGLL